MPIIKQNQKNYTLYCNSIQNSKACIGWIWKRARNYSKGAKSLKWVFFCFVMSFRKNKKKQNLGFKLETFPLELELFYFVNPDCQVSVFVFYTFEIRNEVNGSPLSLACESAVLYPTLHPGFFDLILKWDFLHSSSFIQLLCCIHNIFYLGIVFWTKKENCLQITL